MFNRKPPLKQKSGFITIGVLLISAMFGGGFGINSIKEKVEKGITEQLPKIIGPAKSYDVKVYANGMDLMQHKFDAVEIKGSSVNIAKDFTIDGLFIRMEAVRFNASKQTLTSIVSTSAEVTMKPNDLSKYFAAQYPDMRDVKIKFTKDHFNLSLRPTLWGVGPTVSAEGNAYVKDKSKVYVRFKNFKTAGVSVPKWLRDRIQNHYNPIFDTKDLGIKITLDSVAIEKDLVRIKGKPVVEF